MSRPASRAASARIRRGLPRPIQEVAARLVDLAGQGRVSLKAPARAVEAPALEAPAVAAASVAAAAVLVGAAVGVAMMAREIGQAPVRKVLAASTTDLAILRHSSTSF